MLMAATVLAAGKTGWVTEYSEPSFRHALSPRGELFLAGKGNRRIIASNFRCGRSVRRDYGNLVFRFLSEA